MRFSAAKDCRDNSTLHVTSNIAACNCFCSSRELVWCCLPIHQINHVVVSGDLCCRWGAGGYRGRRRRLGGSRQTRHRAWRHGGLPRAHVRTTACHTAACPPPVFVRDSTLKRIAEYGLTQQASGSVTCRWTGAASALAHSCVPFARTTAIASITLVALLSSVNLHKYR